ncbi:hypothetical protein GCM10007304_19830 [Rhodococcoides trifolii]|uniref:Histone deacetylase n=1 Tax=Rhodococcoides trifolii TaxID=908250 RepID=A0A917D1S9_9NOCA|nr:hypothetical protein [Rhodococcus trifolii]GGG05723.1 hypothetical protein GCM10007304_19830 [Rhodococcus trifolii]
MHLWYVSYGSNLLAERFHTYLTGSDAASRFGVHPPAPDPTLPVDDRWLWIDHALYFAGVSKRWGGSSAFISWENGAEAPSLAHAYLITRDQFAHVAATENGVNHIDLPDGIGRGDWAPLPLPRTVEPHRGKYDALLRLPDIDGAPAWTVTSSVVRERGVPSDAYRATIARGLEDSTLPIDGETYLDVAVGRSRTITLPSRPGPATP